MTTLSRESRTSLDSGFADELRSRFSRSKSKMKKNRKFQKSDISNPLGDVKHLYHIGSSGQSFGDISADMSKAMSDFGKGSTTESMPSSLTPSFSLKSERTNFDSDDAETRFEDYIKEPVNRRSVNQPSLVETCRKSTISFNFDFDTGDDILSSVLAVMDTLKNVRLSEGN